MHFDFDPIRIVLNTLKSIGALGDFPFARGDGIDQMPCHWEGGGTWRVASVS